MSIGFNLPARARQYKPLQIKLTGVYKEIEDPDGNYFAYDFSANGLFVVDAPEDSLFQFERLSLGGNISETEYLDAISVVPDIQLRFENTQRPVFAERVPLSKYTDDRSVTTFVVSSTATKVLLDVKGVLFQTSELVGVDEVDLYLGIDFFLIEGSEYTKQFLNPTVAPKGLR